MSAIDWLAIRADYESGMSLRALAAKYHVGKSTIAERKYKEQWTEGRTVTGHRTPDRKQSETPHFPTHEKGPMTEVQRVAAQRAFLDAYAKQANVMVAARAAGVHRTTIYDWLEKDEAFSFAYNQAKEDARDTIRAEIFRRAHDGWEEPVYQFGSFAGTVRKYSDTLLIFHAKMLMPEYRDKHQIDINATHSTTRDMALQKISDEELDSIASIYQRATQDG